MVTEQPGPSGYKEKRTRQTNTGISFSNSDEPDTVNGKPKKDKSKRPRTQSRYTLVLHKRGTQASNTLKDLQLRPSSTRVEKPVVQQKYIVHQPEPKHSDPQDAADSYLRTHHVHRAGSLLNLAHHFTKRFEDTVRSHRHHQNVSKVLESPKSMPYRIECRNCYAVNSDCVCSFNSVNGRRSDWTVLVQPSFHTNVLYQIPRYNWFLELEQASIVNKRKLLEEKERLMRDPWALPILFASKQLQTINYYLKHP